MTFNSTVRWDNVQKQPEGCVVSTCQRHVRVLTAITRDAWAGAEKKGLQWIPGCAVGGVCTLRSGRDRLERKVQCRGTACRAE